MTPCKAISLGVVLFLTPIMFFWSIHYIVGGAYTLLKWIQRK
jgi:hypothetical protein